MRFKFPGAGHTAELLAVKTLRANVMIADAQLNIIYMNESLTKLLSEAEAELRRELPRFSMATLIGSNVDIFHKQPSHQRGMLRVMENEHTATIKVGSRMFDLVVNPLKRGSQRIGFVVEWSDAHVRLRNLDYAAQNKAFGRSNAIISFLPDGTIVTANQNFLNLMGYALEEIVGKHHSIFIEPGTRNSPEYKLFWEKLRSGEFQSGDFRRVLKTGQLIWLNGSYNPILDDAGKVVRVEKFAVNVTDRVSSVEAVGAALADLADGDLTVRIDKALTVELDELRLNFNRALEKLQGSMQSVGESAGAIERGASDIKSATDDLARRTERQASNLEETAAAVEEITATVRATSENSVRARKIVAHAKTDAEASAEVVGLAVEAMRRIEESSKKISQIIGTIDEIAFQTNLLALNAGVEAARAGDAGRGFAVVAMEVRALAQRSAEAAKEIKALISTSAGQVDEGVKLVEQTGSVLHGIIDQVGEINETMGSIAASAQEQAGGLQTVNQSINEMDKVTQQNAAMVQETTVAVRTLSDETANLGQRLQQFRFDEALNVTRRLASRPRLRAVPNVEEVF